MFDWIVPAINRVLEFFYTIYLTFVQVIENWFYFLLQEFLGIVVMVVNALTDFLTPVDVTQYISMLPDEAVSVMSMLGLPQMMVMIVSSILVRLLLQLIPFTRLGS